MHSRARDVSVHLLPPVRERACIHSSPTSKQYNVNAPTPPKRSISHSTAIQPPQSGVNRSLSPRARPQLQRCLANDSPVEPNRFRAFVVAPRRHPPTRARGGATWCSRLFTMSARSFVRSFEWASMSTSNRAWINVARAMRTGGQVATFVKIAKWQHWNVRRWYRGSWLQY